MPIVNPEDRYRCSHCGLTDRVIKASLSGKVSPPQRNDYGFPKTYESPWGGFSIAFIVLSFAVFLFFLVILIWYASVSAKAANDVAPEFFVTLILAIIAVIVIFHHVQKAKTSRAEVAKYNAELKSRNEADKERYDREMKRYDRLYYCERDGYKFIPEGL